jgi:hypothetical protein
MGWGKLWTGTSATWHELTCREGKILHGLHCIYLLVDYAEQLYVESSRRMTYWNTLSGPGNALDSGPPLRKVQLELPPAFPLHVASSVSIDFSTIISYANTLGESYVFKIDQSRWASLSGIGHTNLAWPLFRQNNRGGTGQAKLAREFSAE